MVKLTIIPRVIPRGFLRPVEPIEVERIIGRSGQMQGVKIVTNPERNAKLISRAIRLV